MPTSTWWSTATSSRATSGHDDGAVKLLDFGIARLLREEEGATSCLRRRAAPVVPPRVCISRAGSRSAGRGGVRCLSLGVVLFELLAGQRPYDLRGKLLAEVEDRVP